MPSKQS
ncbi:hypothetical protein ECEC4196_1815, partial [Escherichia coli EC4196]